MNTAHRDQQGPVQPVIGPHLFQPGLQLAFQVNHLLEILEEDKKAKDIVTASHDGAKNVVTHPFIRDS